jgi:signal transduction histidine kinase/CheY-like chemotaxis protein
MTGEAMVIRVSLRIRCTQAAHALIPMSGALVVVGILLWAYCPPQRLLAWLGSCFVTTAFTAMDCRAMLREIDQASEQQLARFNLHFLITTLLNTLAMGAGIWWVGPVSPPATGFFVTLCICIYAIGHVINSSSHWRSFLAGLVANLGLAIAYWLLQGPEGMAIALMICNIAFLLSTFGRQNAAAFAENVLMREENRALLVALAEEKKAVERALAVAEEANRAKSRFLAAASHDLRQPLHAVGLWAGLVRDSLTTPGAIERGEKLTQSVASLDHLFTGLLDLSRFDSGHVIPERRSFALQSLLHQLEVDFLGEAQAKGLALELARSDAWVDSDPLWLERILRNLLANAIKYTERGAVTVLCNTGRDGGHDTVCIAIRDSGVGITAQARQHIFEEYYQVNHAARSAESAAGGVGLGLAIVRRACEMLGHTLALTSAPGAGSEFSVTLPRCEPDPLASPPAIAEEAPVERLQGMVVVVLEDDENVAAAMDAMLREWQCIAVTGASARNVIGILTQHERVPQMVISDYRLGAGRTGVAEIETLCAMYGALPAVLITGEMEFAALARDTSLKYPVLQKPALPAEIRSVLLAAVS